MQRHEFLLIADDSAAMRLALTWPRLPHEDFDGEDVEEIYADWAEAAGVHVLEVHRCAPMLFANAICLPDGSLDATAQNLITAKLAIQMRAPRQAPPGRRGGAGRP